MRNNIISNLAITLLTIGTIAGYASGIYSVTHRGERRSCDRSSWHERGDERTNDGARGAYRK